MMDWVKEAGLVLKQTVKILLKDCYTVAVLVAGMVILGAMLFCMEDAKTEKSKIIIGIADEDNSELSKSVVDEVMQMELYKVVTGGEKQLAKQLEKGELSAVCVIKEDFARKIERGKTEHLVTIYETKEQGAPLFGDILAGAMMQEICIAKGYLTLLSYEEKAGKEAGLSKEEYRDYVKAVFLENSKEFSFDVIYTDTKKYVEKPTAVMIYEQAVFSVFALFLGLISIYAVLPFRSMRYGHLAKRFKTLPVSEGALYFGSAVGAVIVPVVFSICFLAIFGVKNNLEILQIISLLICTMVYLCVIVCMMLFAAYGIRSQTVYQMGMLAMIFMFGVFGLVSLIDGVFLPEGTVTWVPNGWYVRSVTNLLH